MPAPLRLKQDDQQVVESYLAAMRAVGRKTGRTTQAAWTCQARIAQSGGWSQMTPAQRIEAIGRARSFASWLMVTGQLVVDAEVISALNLHLGHAARSYCREDSEWVVQACARGDVKGRGIGSEWNALAKVSAMTGTSPARVADAEFWPARAAILAAYQRRGMPEAGRSLAAVFNQLQLTLFRARQLSTWKRPSTRRPVSVTGWSTVVPGFGDTARRHIEQVRLSLRPNTVKHIEHDLRRFGSWLTENYPEVASCADLEREHIEAFTTWLSTSPTPRTGKPLNRVSIKNTLSLPGHQVAEPQGHRPDTMDHALEACTQRLRDHLRRPDAQGREPLR